MITDARDIAAVIDYGVRLQELREEAMRRMLDGKPVPGNFIARGEEAALKSVRTRYYNLRMRMNMMSADKAKQISDAQDYEARCTELAEAVTLDTHRKLAAIPCVGQPEYKDA
jgi:hypothetical protein